MLKSQLDDNLLCQIFACLHIVCRLNAFFLFVSSEAQPPYPSQQQSSQIVPGAVPASVHPAMAGNIPSALPFGMPASIPFSMASNVTDSIGINFPANTPIHPVHGNLACSMANPPIINVSSALHPSATPLPHGSAAAQSPAIVAAMQGNLLPNAGLGSGENGARDAGGMGEGERLHSAPSHDGIF